ncbi:MAG: hypothetical protein P1V20_17680 [Verrucomicrobiales bacterium]|nr:hypothetical protein [Verrucomicrobiales bacterium]
MAAISKTIPATFDGSVLKPDSPLDLSPNSRVIVTIVEAQIDGLESEPWLEEDNDRRCELIDKDIQEVLSDQERHELQILQYRFDRYLDEVAPIPIEGAIRIHRELLEKQRKCQGE